MTTEFPSTKRSRVTRQPDRGSHERAVIESILDEGLVARVGLVSQGSPLVIPMAYARDGSHLLLHGAPASRLVRALAEGVDACVSVTLLDGLVLARSAFHSSINYRSVVLFGRCAPLESSGKARALERLTEHLARAAGLDAGAQSTPTELRRSPRPPSWR